MSDIATVYAVFGSHEEAARIGEAMVEQRLAACVNILAPCRSIYRWEGRIAREEEVPALFKTRAELAEALIAAIAAMHGYDVPAAVAWPAAASIEGYARWVVSETAR